MWNSTHEYSASVLVNGRPVTEVEFKGQTFIEGRKNSKYELEFRNNTNNKVLVIPAIDGLSVLDGKLAGIKSPGYVVSPRETLKIPGWVVDNNTAAEFKFFSQGETNPEKQTYAETLGVSENNQGIIGFMVFKEKDDHKQLLMEIQQLKKQLETRHKPSENHYHYHYKYYPSPNWRYGSYTSPEWSAMGGGGAMAYNMSTAKGGTSKSNTDLNDAIATMKGSLTRNVASNSEKSEFMEQASLGTGWGEAVDFNTVESVFVRETPETPCCILSFRYDTLKNLKNMGINVDLFKSHYASSSGTIQAFPASPELNVAKGCKIPAGWNKLKR